MSHIFISYSRKDLATAEKIINALAEDDLKPWIDWKSIPKGEEFEREIQQGIEEADIFLFLVSPDSAQSDWCNKEINHAVKNGKRILPVVLRDTDLKIIHPEISKRNWIFCRSGQDDFNKAMEETRKTVRTDYEWLKYHTELQVKALKWEQNKDTSRLLRGKELQAAEQKLVVARHVKDPESTRLQYEFVTTSRKNETKRQRRVFTGILTGFGLFIVLCVIAGMALVFGYYQKNIASSETIARATAQSAAQSQGEIASGRQLATQAQLLPLYGNSMITSGLLSVEAALRSPDISAQQSLSRFLSVAGNPSANLFFDSMVMSAAFSVDGNFVAVGDAGGVAKIWRIDTFQQVNTLQQEGSIWSIEFSPTDSKIASVGRDLVVWDVVSGDVYFTKSTPSANYSEAMFSSDGKTIITLLSLKESTKLVTYDANNGNELSQYEFAGDNAILTVNKNSNLAVVTQGFDHETLLLQVIDWTKGIKMAEREVPSAYNVPGFYIGNNKILSIEDDFGEISIWDMISGSPKVIQLACKSAVHSMEFDQDINKVAVGCDNGALAIFDSTDLQEIMKTNIAEGTSGDYDPIFEIDFNSDGSRIVTGGVSGTAIVWDIVEKKEVVRNPHNGSIRFSIYSPDQDLVVSGGRDEFSATVWEPNTGLLKLLALQENNIETVSFNKDGNLLVASFPAAVTIWDKQNQKILYDLNLNNTIRGPLVFSRDGLYVIWADNDNNVNVAEIFSGKEISKITNIDWVESISVNNEFDFVVTGGPMIGYTVWNPLTGQMLGNMDYSSDPPILSPTGRFVGYSVWGDNSPAKDLVIRDLSVDQELLSLVDGNNPMSFNEDDTLVAFSNSDFRTLRVWNVQDEIELFSSKHDEMITFMAFSPDNKILITTSLDASIRMFEISTGEEIARFNAPSRINTVAIGQGNQVVFSYNNIAYEWLWDVEGLIDEVCRRLPRNMTHIEWEQYFGVNTQYRSTCPNLPASD